MKGDENETETINVYFLLILGIKTVERSALENRVNGVT